MKRHDMPVLRYGIRTDGKGGWAVYDVLTDLVAVVDDNFQDGLDLEQADELVNLLNAENHLKSQSTKH